MTDFDVTRALEIIREHITTVANFKIPSSGLGSRLGVEFSPRWGVQSIAPVTELLVADIAKAFDYLHSTRIAAYDALAADAAAALHHIRDQIVAVRTDGAAAMPAQFFSVNDELRACYLETQSFIREHVPMSEENSVDVTAVFVDRVARGVAEGSNGPFTDLVVEVGPGVRTKPTSLELGVALARLAAALDSRLAKPPVVDLRPFLIRAELVAKSIEPGREPAPFAGTDQDSPEVIAVAQALDEMVRRLRTPYDAPATPKAPPNELEETIAEWAMAERAVVEDAIDFVRRNDSHSPQTAAVVRTAVSELADRRALKVHHILGRMGVSRQMLRNLVDVEG